MVNKSAFAFVINNLLCKPIFQQNSIVYSDIILYNRLHGAHDNVKYYSLIRGNMKRVKKERNYISIADPPTTISAIFISKLLDSFFICFICNYACSL